MSSSAGRDAQSEIYRDGVAGRRPRIPVGYAQLERAAQRRLSRAAFAYIAGSAGLERTADANTEAFRRRRIVPRVLRDVSARDLSVELFGVRRATPLLLAPIGVLELARRGGDAAAARAAAALGVPAVLSNQASQPMEEVVGAMADVAPAASRWFQLYWSSSRDLVASLVERAERSGCEAIVVTLDTHVLGWRPRDLALGYLPFSRGLGIAQYTSDPVFQQLVRERAAVASGPRPTPTPAAVAAFASILRHHPGPLREKLRSGEPLAAVETFLDVFADPSLTWDDLAFLRERTRLPIVLKGVLHPDDARRALDAGVDAIQVSNHGGRQIDGEVAALDALPAVVAAVDGRVPVIFDSGIRGGADAVIALALGARAVATGRPYAYALAVAGEAGVRELLRNTIAELDITLGLAGVRSVAELDAGILSPYAAAVAH
ncbi:lactate 2-monooxygenase [Leifsonia sp. 98AMF]|uniref:alpha-hydroxy-acid oxidizing protein n=1 Tax=unclassified Leifsonia TaxID=2663824 RepID=UPI00087CBB89|nr:MULTISPECIES: alpha-hydroxy-acid oxidizing protein [unclassified Leifsonia]SDH25610.1 lactate 2-monooxygenase [Leifsonia sp. 197AMF]SDJ12792.1 lactate 2-monooxygenase [Leifsonia sp. 466MF]SDJ56337.1 lactate 2-monooxygenase [Leifsonia sp. 157MF]SDN34309.1 lactate 2-monooxygenase [Leifsonia sp. 509MF]SEM87436.1 lactate 2-monooxygenase [Leifsonia sp. 467MF]